MKKGEVYIYTPTGKEITLDKLTDTRVSWYVGFTSRMVGYGKYEHRMAWSSKKQFEDGIKEGIYKIK